MKIPFRSAERLIATVLRELNTPYSEVRSLLVRIVRGEVKNYLAELVDTELLKFEEEVNKRVQRALESLGSASPEFDAQVQSALELTDKGPGKETL